MRIIGGNLRGRNILAPRNLPVRPTTDFAKTALFNILHNHYNEEAIRVLDLFSGTGCISYEFASRGCSDITCVDQHAGCVRFIKETAAQLKIEGLRTVRADVFGYLDHCTEQYDIIFADPPFEMEETDSIPGLVASRKLLLPGGVLIVEHASNRTLHSNPLPGSVRSYSNCAFSFYWEKDLGNDASDGSSPAAN